MRTRSGFTATLKTALNADITSLRPPTLDPTVARDGFKSYGIVPQNLRGLVDLHYRLQTETRSMHATIDDRLRRCAAGDCDCRKSTSVDEGTLIKQAVELITKLTKLETILVDELAPSLGGLDLSKATYAVAGDWSIMASADALDARKGKRSVESLLSTLEKSLGADSIGEDMFGFGDSPFGSSRLTDILAHGPFGSIDDLPFGGRRRSAADIGVGLGLNVRSGRVRIDLDAIKGMDKDQVKAHIRAKLRAELPRSLVDSMDRVGELDRIVTDAMSRVSHLPDGPSARRRDHVSA